MSRCYAVRIARSYALVERAVHAIALRCDKVLAYEHVGSATEKVHVHLMLVGVRCDEDTLKNDCKRNGLATLKGNGDWSFKTKDKKYGDVEDSPKYITYMTKGVHDPKYNKGYTDDELKEAKESWVPPSKQKSKASKYYYEFELVMPKDLPQPQVIMSGGVSKVIGEYDAFNLVRSRAFAFCMEKFDLQTQACKQTIQMLYRTYCYKHNVRVPERFDTI